MRKRLLTGLGLCAAALWLASAALYWWGVGASAADVVPGPLLAPTLLAQQLLAPEAPFVGLPQSAALSQLRLAFGQGVRPADGRLLHDLIVSRGCRRVLDVGTARGYAAVWFGLAARRTAGHVVTIEIDRQVAAEARENIRRAGLADVVVFVDPGAPLNERVLELVGDRVPAGGLVVAHNALWLRLSEPGLRRAIRENPHFETTIVPTLSGGLSITTRKWPLARLNAGP